MESGRSLKCLVPRKKNLKSVSQNWNMKIHLLKLECELRKKVEELERGIAEDSFIWKGSTKLSASVQLTILVPFGSLPLLVGVSFCLLQMKSGNSGQRVQENKHIASLIEKIHMDSPDKGYRRIHDDLERFHNVHSNDKRILRICRSLGIQSTVKFHTGRLHQTCEDTTALL